MDEERGPDTEDIGGSPPGAPRPDAEPGDVGRPGRLARARGAVADLADGRRWPGLRVVVFALAGASLAVVVFGHVSAKVGPFETTLSARPSLTGQTVVHLAPLGTIQIDTHDWPVRSTSASTRSDWPRPNGSRENPDAIDTLGDDAADEVRSALVGLAIRCVIVALLGGIAGALVARLNWRTACAGAGVAMVFVTSVGLGAAATFDAERGGRAPLHRAADPGAHRGGRHRGDARRASASTGHSSATWSTTWRRCTWRAPSYRRSPRTAR